MSSADESSVGNDEFLTMNSSSLTDEATFSGCDCANDQRFSAMEKRPPGCCRCVTSTSLGKTFDDGDFECGDRCREVSGRVVGRVYYRRRTRLTSCNRYARALWSAPTALPAGVTENFLFRFRCMQDAARGICIGK